MKCCRQTCERLINAVLRKRLFNTVFWGEGEYLLSAADDMNLCDGDIDVCATATV